MPKTLTPEQLEKLAVFAGGVKFPIFYPVAIGEGYKFPNGKSYDRWQPDQDREQCDLLLEAVERRKLKMVFLSAFYSNLKSHYFDDLDALWFGVVAKPQTICEAVLKVIEETENE